MSGLFDRLFPAGSRGRPSSPALRRGEDCWTYAQMRSLVSGAALRLRSAGVRKGDRVLLLLGNSPEYVVAFLAVTAAGGVAVPVDPKAGPGRLRAVAAGVTPRLCLRSPSGRARPVGGLESYSISVPPGARAPAFGPPLRSRRGGLPKLSGEDDAAILFSAGSTGDPKAAVLKHAQFLWIARTLTRVARMDRRHRDLILGPMTHSGAWQRVLATFLAGGCVVIFEGPPAMPGLLEAVRERGITGFFAAPPLLRVLLKASAAKVRAAAGSLKSVETASAPLSPAEVRGLLDLLPGTRLLLQYGLTECSRAFILSAREFPAKLHTVGRPTRGVKAVIEGPDGGRLGPGDEGEILLSAPQRAGRYWRQPELSRERLRGPWLRTGDFGSLDPDGFLVFRGRRDDMINCGGLSFFPAEAERELGKVPGVREYSIAGVPDPQGLLHQVPWAFVVPRRPESWSPRAFLETARRRLAPHMIPRRAVVVGSLEAGPTGKISRMRIVERHGPRRGRT